MTPHDTRTTGWRDLGDRITERIRADEQLIVDLCRELVEAPSVNPPGDTRSVASLLGRFFDVSRVPWRVEQCHPLMPNIVATVDGAAPGPHLILNVHLDTMPPGDTAAWLTDPFRLIERDGRLIGLGIGNMKGAAAAMAVAYRHLYEHRRQWCGRITFTAVSDEVVFGPHGAQHLLEQPGFVGDALLCGEGPGFGDLALAEKGVRWIRIEAVGPAGHSSGVVRGTSATVRIACAIEAIDALNGRRGDIPVELTEVATSRPEAWTLTANVGRLEGGTFIGQCPTAASAEVDIRIPPGLSLDAVDLLVAEALSGIEGVSWTVLKGWEPNWTAPTDTFVKLVQESISNERGGPARTTVRLPASDASRWRLAGMPAVCFGPQATLSAGLNEDAARSEVIDCAAIYARTAVGLLR